MKHHPRTQPLLLCIGICLLLLGCNGPKRAYYYYQVDALEPHLFTVGDSLPGENPNLLCCDAVTDGRQVGILLQPRVHYYYKTKEKNYSPALRGSKCSEEKITALDLFLVEGSDTVHLENAVLKFKPIAYNMVTFTVLNVGIAPSDNRRLFSLPEFVESFNECGMAFAADHEIAISYLFWLEAAALPSGNQVLVCRVRFDSGRELVSQVAVRLK